MTNPAPSGTDQPTPTGRARTRPVGGSARPASRWSRWRVVAATMTVGAVALAPFVLDQGPAQAGPALAASTAVPASVNEPCLDNVGITVVVDFQELGGGVNVRCAPGPVVDGFDAFAKAGINYQTTVRFSGFVCKIAGLPADDPCINTSPADAYWSYWIAPRGGEWCYSNLGAGARTGPLPPGSIEGWSFSKDKQSTTTAPPRYTPPAALPGQAPNQIPRSDCDGNVAKPPNPGPPDPVTPTTTARSNPTAPPTAGGGGGGSGAPGGSGDVPATPGPETPDSSVADATTTTAAGEPAADDATADATEVPVGEAVDQAAGRVQTNPDGTEEALGEVDLSSDGSSTGSVTGVALAVGAIVVLGGGAVFITRRRRASNPT